jgi:tannase
MVTESTYNTSPLPRSKIPQLAYNTETDTWELSVSGFGSEYPARFLRLLDTDTLSNYGNVTYDTLKYWMIQGWQMYDDSLQTSWPDLTPFLDARGKVLHFHSESDNRITTASSMRYQESVRQIP